MHRGDDRVSRLAERDFKERLMLEQYSLKEAVHHKEKLLESYYAREQDLVRRLKEAEAKLEHLTAQLMDRPAVRVVPTTVCTTISGKCFHHEMCPQVRGHTVKHYGPCSVCSERFT